MVSFLSAYFSEYPYENRRLAAEAGCDTYDSAGVDHRHRNTYFDEGNQYWAVECEALNPASGSWQKSGGFALFEGDPCRYFWSDIPPCCPPGTAFESTSLQCARYDCPLAVTTLGLCPIEPSERCLGNPVDPGPGIKLQVEEDYLVSGSPLKFARYYNSHLDYRSTPDGLQPKLSSVLVTPHTDFSTWQANVPAGYVPASGTLAAPSQFGNERWRSNFDAKISFFDDPHNDGASVLRPDGDQHSYLHEVGDRFRATTDPGALLEWLPGTPGGVQWRYYRADELIEEFDADGRLLAIQTRQGHVQSLSYDQSGRLLRVESNQGKYIVFDYDAEGRLVELADKMGRIWQYRYDQADNLLEVVNPDGTARTYHYEDTGFPHALTGITDERDIRYSTYAYDSQGRTILTTHAGDAGRVDITYMSDGSRAVKNSRGEISTYFTQRQGGETLITRVDGPGCSTCGSGDAAYDYDPADNTLLSKTENGVTTRYGSYDLAGNPGFMIEAAGTSEERRVDYTYDARYPRRIASLTESSVFPGASKITTYTYDDFGNRTSETVEGFSPAGVTVTRSTVYEYDGPLHELSRIDGPREDVDDTTLFEYHLNDPSAGDDRGRLKRIIGPEGIIERDSIRYTSTGKVKSELRPDGLTITYSYYPANDRLETLTETSVSGERVTRWTYLPTGEVDSITVADGTAQAITTTFAYDAARRLVRITDGHGNYTEYTLDAEGNRLAETVYGSAGDVKKMMLQTFDVYNRLASTSRATRSTYYDYTADGLLKLKTDGNGVVTEFGYDALNRLVRTTQDPGNLNVTTINSFDASDQPVSVTDPNGLVTAYEYDDLGNRLTQDSPDTGVTRYTYDTSGNPISQTDARGITVEYSYDAADRLLEVRYPNSSQNISYQYDACTGGAGHLCRMIDETGITAYTYDAFGNRVSETRGSGEESGIIRYVYDAPGNLAGIVYPSGREVNYVRDAAGRITRVMTTTDATTELLVSGISYLPFGPVDALTYGNGLQETRTHDDAYRITGINIENQPERKYIYDSAGNITEIRSTSGVASVEASTETGSTDTADVGELDNGSGISMGSVAVEGQEFVYDALDRLIRENGAYGQRVYSYDKNGNRTQRIKTDNTLDAQGGIVPKVKTQQYRYAGGTHHLVRIDSTTDGIATSNSIAYDEVGNTLSKTSRSKDFSYDDTNRLTTYTKDGQLKAEYFYNGQGQRITKIKHKDDGSTLTIHHHYDQDGKLLALSRYDGDVQKAYKEFVWLADQPIAQITTRYKSDLTVKNQTIVYLHTDHLNTPRFATDSDQNTVWRWDGDAFGQGRPDTDPDGDGANTFVPLRFPGQIASEGGLFYNYFRFYETASARYITSDPVGLDGGTNTYLYVGGNPIGFRDVTGLRYSPYEHGRDWDGNPVPGPFGPVCGPGDRGTNIPDRYGPWNFSDSCGRHDACYETCGADQFECDRVFYRQLQRECSRHNSPGGCLVFALAYYDAVKRVGKKSYDDAQQRACKTCKK